MNVENVLLGIAVHQLFWEHLPHWGRWFNRLLGMLPKPLQALYEQWRCPYCAGFWIGLSVHAATGRWVFDGFAQLPSFWGAAGVPLGWFMDALVFATLCKLGALVVHAIGLPALKGLQAKETFLAQKAKAN
ncbi:hypothetical protein [Shimia sp.]|uniref:hypothetical protein n=1 Tax=Shimia sp. TaxID=1954381 RepID=UPI003B8E8A7F